MQLTRTRELTVRMGDYESFKFSASVSLSHQDLGFSDDDVAKKYGHVASALQDFVGDQLDAALQMDIEDAAALTGDRKSFIHRLAPASASAATTTPTKKKD